MTIDWLVPVGRCGAVVAQAETATVRVTSGTNDTRRHCRRNDVTVASDALVRSA
jgi:hypothetical protein